MGIPAVSEREAAAVSEQAQHTLQVLTDTHVHPLGCRNCNLVDLEADREGEAVVAILAEVVEMMASGAAGLLADMVAAVHMKAVVVVVGMMVSRSD